MIAVISYPARLTRKLSWTPWRQRELNLVPVGKGIYYVFYLSRRTALLLTNRLFFLISLNGSVIMQVPRSGLAVIIEEFWWWLIIAIAIIQYWLPLERTTPIFSDMSWKHFIGIWPLLHQRNRRENSGEDIVSEASRASGCFVEKRCGEDANYLIIGNIS